MLLRQKIGVGMIFLGAFISLDGHFGSPVGSRLFMSCEEKGKVYKVCRDQKEIYEHAKAQALAEKKGLLVVVGADWCPWCVVLHRALEKPGNAAGIRDEVVVVHVAYMGNQLFHVPTGFQVAKAVAAQSRSPASLDYIPAVFLVRPELERSVQLDMDAVEKGNGYDEPRLLEQVRKMNSYLREQRREDRVAPAPGRGKRSA